LDTRKKFACTLIGQMWHSLLNNVSSAFERALDQTVRKVPLLFDLVA
jgi:hypothetical protein